jgi:hypothetical protein
LWPPEATFRVLSIKSLNGRTQVEVEASFSLKLGRDTEIVLHARKVIDPFDVDESRPGDLWRGTFEKVAP